MPRSDRAQPPGPFTPSAQVRRVGFRFNEDARRQLAQILPAALRRAPLAQPAQEAALRAAGKPVPATAAGWLIAAAEEQIDLLLSARAADRGAEPGNPANYRAGIRKLRAALKPFVAGWADAETCDLAGWAAIDAALARREAELAAVKRPAPAERRALQYNCQRIAEAVRYYGRLAGVEIKDAVIMRFIAAALGAAGIPHPDPESHRPAMAALCFAPRPGPRAEGSKSPLPRV